MGNASVRRQMVGTPERRMPAERIPIEMRETPNGTGSGPPALTFSGYASVVERRYEISDAFGVYGETMARGAFNKSLNEGADVNFLVNHQGISMARTKSGTLRLASDQVGLHAEARLDPNRSDVQILRSAVESGDLDEMSFSFRVVQQQWDDDYEERRILEVNLNQGDVCVCNYAANPHTAGLVTMRRKGTPDPSARRPLRRIYVPNYTRGARDRLRLLKAKAS